jgi:AcrR family transcriptional regulator
MPDDANIERAPPRSSRTRLAPELRRAQLLDGAMRLFEHRAYDVVTLEGIAEQAGVSPALVYHYFGSKREVFLAVVVRAIDGFQEAVAGGESSGGEGPLMGRDGLRAALERYLDFVLERPNGYAFVIGARGAPDDEVRSAIDAARESVHRAVLGLIGVPEPDVFQDLAMWGWLGFVERATTRWVARGEGDRSALIEMLLGAAAPVLGLAQHASL